MAKEIQNQAMVKYTISGGKTISETSNIATVNLIDDKGLSIKKSCQSCTFIAGGMVTYYIEIENTGTQYFSGVRINDDLGGDNPYLTYVEGSGVLYYNDQALAAEVASTDPLVFTLSPLASGKKMILSYTVKIANYVPPEVDIIVNSVEGIGYTSSGEVKDYSSTQVTRVAAPQVSIVKTSSSSQVAIGEMFTYSIVMTNEGNSIANIDTISDQLPENFKIISIQLKTKTSTTTLNPSDYNLSASNTLQVPSATGPKITIPAAVFGDPGQTILIITGSFEK